MSFHLENFNVVVADHLRQRAEESEEHRRHHHEEERRQQQEPKEEKLRFLSLLWFLGRLRWS